MQISASMIRKYIDFINESIRYLSTEELFNWLRERRDYVFVALDTETTGLKGPRMDQLTQIAAIAFSFDYDSLKFTEIDKYNKKISLTPEIKSLKELPDSKIKGALKYNRYGVSRGKFEDEQTVINELVDFVGQFENTILMIQNAPFDMPMINVRAKFKRLNSEIFDTKDFFAYFLIPTLEKLAENDPEVQAILNTFGKSSSGKLYTSSLPKVAAGLGIDPSGAHDALYDCTYMVQTLEKALEIVKSNPDIERNDLIRQRILTDRYIKAKNNMNVGNLR
jgi:DNA polymerase III epsilon subunit-like protein